ncbi:MAG TPA: hypothetical protein VLJ39_14845 [Tepidisphaeraceae bacterium]|nr:hypothetical protein [Tepidisphaeraceae bacterium]
MPALLTNEAAQRLAEVVEKAKPPTLTEFYAELFPEKPVAVAPSAAELAQHVRSGLEAEELVDLWNVVFPADRNVWYDEEDKKIHYNEEAIGFAEAD